MEELKRQSELNFSKKAQEDKIDSDKEEKIKMLNDQKEEERRKRELESQQAESLVQHQLGDSMLDLLDEE